MSELAGIIIKSAGFTIGLNSFATNSIAGRIYIAGKLWAGAVAKLCQVSNMAKSGMAVVAAKLDSEILALRFSLDHQAVPTQ